jgi:hypothetical protein
MGNMVRKIGSEPEGKPLAEQGGTYRAFGLTIQSEIPLPELMPAPPGPVDLVIALRPTGRPTPRPEDGVSFAFTADEHYLAWPGVAAFRIHGTERIDVEPDPEAPLAYLAFPLLGPVLGLLLHLRGLLVLHASAIDIGGRSAIFVGDKMAGKSTTAAAFLRAGHRLLTDDLLAIDLSDPAHPQILPAFPQLKLSDDASAAVRIDGAEALPLVYEGFEKRQHRLGGEFSFDQITPSRLYVLDRGGDVPHAFPLTGIEALKAVLRFSYIVRFGKEALPGKLEAEHMQRCAALARTVQVARLQIPADLARLDETVALVENAVGAP